LRDKGLRLEKCGISPENGWLGVRLPPVSDFSTRRKTSTSHHRQLFVYLAGPVGGGVSGWLGGCVGGAFTQAYPQKCRICLALCRAPFFDVLTPRPGPRALNPRVQIHKLNSSNIFGNRTF